MFSKLTSLTSRRREETKPAEKARPSNKAALSSEVRYADMVSRLRHVRSSPKAAIRQRDWRETKPTPDGALTFASIILSSYCLGFISLTVEVSAF
jgi:hypothetical protein